MSKASQSGRRRLNNRVRAPAVPDFKSHLSLPEAKKGRSAMKVSPEATSISMTAHAEPTEGSRQQADLLYQTVTVAAILLVLGSLWAF